LIHRWKSLTEKEARRSGIETAVKIWEARVETRKAAWYLLGDDPWASLSLEDPDELYEATDNAFAAALAIVAVMEAKLAVTTR
jgi:hypothetical protein